MGDMTGSSAAQVTPRGFVVRHRDGEPAQHATPLGALWDATRRILAGAAGVEVEDRARGIVWAVRRSRA